MAVVGAVRGGRRSSGRSKRCGRRPRGQWRVMPRALCGVMRSRNGRRAVVPSPARLWLRDPGVTQWGAGRGV
eukprot:12895999-Prorocentrum_lima.AAC.1